MTEVDDRGFAVSKFHCHGSGPHAWKCLKASPGQLRTAEAMAAWRNLAVDGTLRGPDNRAAALPQTARIERLHAGMAIAEDQRDKQRQASQQRKLGRTALKASAFALGTAPIGNLFRAITDAESDAMFRTAWDAGGRYFDTAPM